MSVAAGPSPNYNDALLVARTRRLYEQSLRGMPFSFMIGGMVVAGLESARGSVDLIWWWAALAVLTLVRHNHARRVLCHPITPANARSLSAWFNVGAAAEGLMWGVSFLIVALFIGGRATVFMGCAVAGICVAALTTMAPGRIAFPAFLACLSAPVLATLILTQQGEGSSVGAMVVLFGLNLGLAYTHAHGASTSEIRLQFDQQNAVDALARANRRIEMLSRTDGLTGLANRREFDERLEIEWIRSQRSRQPLGLVMLDIDRFKQFNDAGGHRAGDDCLKQVARIIRAAIARPGDLVARFGGEEFVVLLPNTSEEGALAVAETIRRAVEDARLPRPDTSDQGVTLSAGAAAIAATPDLDATSLIETADRALYLAKAQGRNRARSLMTNLPAAATQGSEAFAVAARRDTPGTASGRDLC